jgi:hypothetical protein
LIAEATEVDLVRAEQFETCVREDLATWREQRSTGRDTDTAKDAITIPSRYSSEPELYLIFDVFVRAFLLPIIVADAVQTELTQDGVGDGIERVSFSRFGELDLSEGISAIAIRDTPPSSADELSKLAEEIGMVLLGSSFQLSDFLEGSE